MKLLPILLPPPLLADFGWLVVPTDVDSGTILHVAVLTGLFFPVAVSTVVLLANGPCSWVCLFIWGSVWLVSSPLPSSLDFSGVSFFF